MYTDLYDYGFDETYLDNPKYSLNEFTENQKIMIRDSLDEWSNISGINFIEIEETTDGNNYGDLRFFSKDFTNWVDIDPFYDGGYAGFSIFALSKLKQ